jgi:hypothetical protein
MGMVRVESSQNRPLPSMRETGELQSQELTAKDAKEIQKRRLEPRMNANKDYLRLSAFIGGSSTSCISSCPSCRRGSIPPRISLANLGVLGG